MPVVRFLPAVPMMKVAASGGTEAGHCRDAEILPDFARGPEDIEATCGAPRKNRFLGAKADQLSLPSVRLTGASKRILFRCGGMIDRRQLESAATSYG